jgi:hypothetical protein
MNTKKLISTENTENQLQIMLDVKVPNLMNIAQLNPNDIQTAFNHFFRQNPQLLVQIFATLEKTSTLVQQPKPLLPQVTKAQRETILATIAKTVYPSEDADSEQWIKTIQTSRINKDIHHSLNSLCFT